MYLLGSVFLIGLGLLMLLRPEAFYQLTEAWKNDGAGEPSRAYLWGTRFGGVMCLLAGLCGGAVLLFF